MEANIQSTQILVLSLNLVKLEADSKIVKDLQMMVMIIRLGR